MTSVVGNQKTKSSELHRVGRCLKGLIDGKKVFRFIGETPRREKVPMRPSRYWIEEGYYNRNILDE
jgi:hypothetical protein